VTHALSLIDRVAERSSNHEIARAARAVAASFTRAGLAPGDRVLFAVRPGIRSLPLVLGISDAGGVIVPAPIGAGQAVFDARMRLIRPSWIVGESWLLAAMRSPAARRVLSWFGRPLASLDSLPDIQVARVRFAGATDAAVSLRFANGNGAMAAEPSFHSDDPLFVVFTSGTTDDPKAVLHSRRSFGATIDVIGQSVGFDTGDVLYARDMHLVLPALCGGARVVFPRSLHPAAHQVLADLRAESATHAFFVAADCQSLVDHLEGTSQRFPDSLRSLILGAAPVRAPFLRRLQRVVPPHTKVLCVYGMTEMLPVASIGIEEKLALAADGDPMGRLVPGVQARTADDGELHVAGPHLCAGYVGHPPMREHATGDLARLDGDRVTLLGRKKDMIIRGATNIYPELHEPVIEEIPGVRRAAMVGVFDESAADERVVLFVEPDERAAAGAAFERDVRRELMNGRHRIDDSAQPDLIVVAPIPLAGRSRKVDKSALRRIAQLRLAR
jgi:long-chain acyl-CoA synthetase